MTVLESGLLSGFVARAGDAFYGGPQVREFETLIKSYFDVHHAVAVNSATAALHAAVVACGIGLGDEVIVTPYSMSASATAIVMANATPIFADIEEDSFCLDPQAIRDKISDKTKAILLVHLFGGAGQLSEIMKIAEEHDLYVIEDCAQAPGARYQGQLVGALGDVGVFSLNQHKTITCGEGGLAITNDDNLALRMQLVRNHGEVTVEALEAKGADDIVGFNYRMTEIEAALAIEQWKRLDFLNERRISLANYLTTRLSRIDGLILPKIRRDDKNVFFVYPIRIQENVLGIDRNTLVKALAAEGVPSGAGYVRPIYREPLYRRVLAQEN